MAPEANLRTAHNPSSASVPVPPQERQIAWASGGYRLHGGPQRPAISRLIERLAPESSVAFSDLFSRIHGCIQGDRS
jgi:hypothetical protein